jgi:hypothetical protein
VKPIIRGNRYASRIRSNVFRSVLASASCALPAAAENYTAESASKPSKPTKPTSNDGAAQTKLLC